MKFYIDIATRRFVRGPASSIPLDRLFLKRRDKIDVEIVFVEKSAIVATPSGTSFSTGLKTNFSDSAFLALSDSTGLLDLHTTAIEALFANDPASVSAYLEVKTSRPGEETRTSTLGVDIENSVILGDEGSPAAEVSLKATSADAISGVSNEKWMTPLRVSEAIAALGGGSGGTAVNWNTLTGKPASFPPSSHTHPISEVSGLQTALNSKQAAGSYAAATHTHDASSITSGTLSIDRIPVLPSQAPVVVNGLLASITSSQESSIVTGTVVITSDGKRYVYKGTGAKTSADSYIILADIAPSWASISEKPAVFSPEAHAHLVSDVAGLQGALDAKQPAGSYASATQGAKADTASQPGHIHTKADVTGLDSALATKITGSGVADMQVVTALPSSPSPTTFYIVIAAGATTASAVTLGSVSLFTGSGGGGGGGGGEPTLWSPSGLAGLQMWYAAEDETITSSGGKVSEWRDKSGNNRHAVQTVAANQPTYFSSDPFGRKSVGNTTSSGLRGLICPSTTYKEVFIVGYYKNGTESTFGEYATLFSGPSASSAYRVIGSLSNGFVTGGAAFASSVFKNAAATATVAPLPLPPTVMRFSSGGARTQETYLFHSSVNVDRSFVGGFSEVLFFASNLSTTDRQKVEGYLAHKWDLSVDLPADHPYKAAAPPAS